MVFWHVTMRSSRKARDGRTKPHHHYLFQFIWQVHKPLRFHGLSRSCIQSIVASMVVIRDGMCVNSDLKTLCRFNPGLFLTVILIILTKFILIIFFKFDAIVFKQNKQNFLKNVSCVVGVFLCSLFKSEVYAWKESDNLSYHVGKLWYTHCQIETFYV